MPKYTQIYQVSTCKQGEKDLASLGVKNESIQWRHLALLLDQVSCCREGRGNCFSLSRELTFGRGTALALRILSAVQYLRASSGGVCTVCLVTLFDEADFEKRFQ